MSMLLKSVWRNVLKSNQLGKSVLKNYNYTSSASELTPAKSPDVISTSLKSAPSPTEVLACVQTHLPYMTHKHMLLALRCLFDMHKTGRFSYDSDNLLKDPAFGVLCQNFKKHSRSLDVNEAIEATKVLSYLRVPVDSLIVQTMLQIIRCNINLVNIRQIMFLDFLLGRFDSKNHLVDALRLALPLAFQIHLPLELDHDDLPLLRDMLAYCCMHDLPDRCINNVVTGLLLHDQSIDAQIAKSIIWSLCQTNCTEERFPTRAQLLHICFDILTQRLEQLSYDEVLKTAAMIKGRVLEKHPEYYHEQLMDAIANYVIENEVEFEKGLLIARILSRIAHTHLGLTEYLCRLAASQPETLAKARTNIFFGFINCLSNNNYTPDPHIWETLKRQISLNPILEGKNVALPWTKACLEMASLGYYDDKLLKRVFSKEFLDEFLARENNKLDYLQLLTLREAVCSFHSDQYSLPEGLLKKAQELYPLHSATEQLAEALGRGLGGAEYAVKNVVLPNGIVSDVLMCVKAGSPVALRARRASAKVPLAAVNVPPDGVIVCILNFHQGCFSMNSNRLRGTFRLIVDILEKQGYAAVAVNASEWAGAPPHERTPYLLREVGYKCGEIGIKLSAV